MSRKYRITHEQQVTSHPHSDLSPYQRPVKSPSPDKKPSNIIASTKSPQIHERKLINSHYQPEHQLSSWPPLPREKAFTIVTPSKFQREHHQPQIEETQATNHEQRFIESEPKYFSYASNSRARNTKIQIVAETEDFQSRGSRGRDLNRSESMQLDYLKLLKSKEETIKELREIIDMIKRNNSSMEESEQQFRHKQLLQRIRELQSQVKELKIENQHLLNAFEKKLALPYKEEILQREIRQLKASLQDKQLELDSQLRNIDKQASNFKQEIGKLQNQNQSLLRLLKEKQQSLGNSALSVQSKASDKEKLSLIKIKEQHQQNLKLMQENFYREIQELQRHYQEQLDELARQLEVMHSKTSQLEMFKSKILRKIPKEEEKAESREQYHKEKVRHQEIESLMLQKYSKYQNDIAEHKKTNDRLIQELIRSNKTIDELSLKLQEQGKIKDLSSQLDATIQQRNSILRELELLSKQHDTLKQQFKHFGINKTQEIQQLEKKIELILMEYEHHQKEQGNHYQQQITRLKQDFRLTKQKEQQLIEYYQKDKADTEQKVTIAIDLYNKQNETLKTTLSHKNSQLLQLSQLFQSLKREHGSCSREMINQEQLNSLAIECEQLRVRCHSLQTETKQLNDQLIQLDHSLKLKNEYSLRLEESVTILEAQKDHLGRQLAETQIKNNDLAIVSSRKEREIVDLQERIQLLQKSLGQMEQDHLLVTSQLKQEILEQEQKIQQFNSYLKGKQQELTFKNGQILQLQQSLHQKQFQYLRLQQNQLLQEELKELRRLICQYYLKTSSSNQKEIVEQFYKLSYSYEMKVDQNAKLLKEIEQIKTQLGTQQREHQILTEKIRLLQSSNEIYQRQLRQRRYLYDQLLQQKVRNQKEVQLSKKIKVEQSHIENNYKGNFNDITSRIDKLLDLEHQRNQKMKGMVLVRQASLQKQ